ncbi:tetratricopeptide repeat protein [Aestuariibacter halophilus]|uniref:Tetratricopeptide repeat protein n=1 Tax=Fluctibacter halophilus TaxID=226011 RepID=A0ABS8G6U4_9ALTE|nr:tetratricopeptide repeat protein [Aestuariibacter halophilus]MCC2616312.1 tetratricopeptide repeat protein [Aestuariibacter halophilus]
MNNRKRFGALVTATFALSALSNPALADACDDQDRTLRDMLFVQQLPVVEGLAYWKAAPEGCSDSGFYYHKLGGLYLNLKDYESARKAYQQGLIYDDHFRPILLASIGESYAQPAMRGDNVEHNARLAEEHYQSTLETYPDHYIVTQFYASFLLHFERYDEAIEYAERSNRATPNYLSMRNLTILYMEHQNAPEKALAMGELAMKNMGHFNTDLELQLAIIRAYAEIGNFRQSVQEMKTLVEKNNKVLDDPRFNDMYAYIRELAVEADRKNAAAAQGER